MALPTIEERGAGWLRYLDRKLQLPGDDWSRAGTPAAAWDNLSGAPTTNWYRFDAIGIALTVSLAARAGRLDVGSARRMLDGIAARMCQYHAFNEWVEQRGPDPGRDEYPEGWNGMLIPAGYWGAYDTPGWAANGTQAAGYQPNPIENDGAIYYKGFLNLVLALRASVGPPPDPTDDLTIVYSDELRFDYTHADLNTIVEGVFAAALGGRADGLCCEIHKLWPL